LNNILISALNSVIIIKVAGT